jgi:hypothetical protein
VPGGTGTQVKGATTMASSQRENRVAVSATKFLVRSMISLILCACSAVCAQAQDAQSNNTNESWTATAQTSGDNANPSRTMESHTKSGNRSVDKKRAEVLGLDGRYQPDSDTETETIQVNATTTRTVVRIYRWDANGQQRYLVLVTEEEARSSANGDAHVVSTTSNPDVNGNLQVVQREVVDTRKTSPDAQETKTTVYVTDGSGGFTPSLQTQELQTRSADHGVAVKKTTLLPDGNGKWAVGEVKENTIKGDDKNRTSEERVSRSNSEGGLSEVSHTVGKETETPAGEKNNTVETYSTDISGLATDGSLRLNWRVTTVQKKDADGKTTEQQVEQPNPDNANAGLQVNAKTKYTVRYASSGTQKTKTVQTRDINGNFDVVSVETEESDQVPAEQVQKAPSDKPK